ncbi:hypothetical protein FOA52_012137 [Chlamydomonas sp. UWO 241]|nr:hypothetical protein FOA52_012137 [Chlamydomonas sp. UWO 241]
MRHGPSALTSRPGHARFGVFRRRGSGIVARAAVLHFLSQGTRGAALCCVWRTQVSEGRHAYTPIVDVLVCERRPGAGW